MSNPALQRLSLLVRLSIGATALGVLMCLPLLIHESAYTLVIFMFLGQPLVAAGFVFFVMKVFQTLRRRELI
jgi:hypothetical protein